MSNQITPQDVLNALRAVKDPDLGRDIVTLGFIKELEVGDKPRLVRAATDHARLPGARPTRGAGAGGGDGAGRSGRGSSSGGARSGARSRPRH